MGLEFPTCHYRIDSKDQLKWVDEWWLAFARENGGGKLAAQDLLGRSLWDFITDGTTAKWYARIHEHVRETGRSVVVPVRCDSATMRRQTQLMISREGSDDLLYEALLLWARPQGPFRLLDPRQQRSEETVTFCSCCKRGLVESDRWLEIDEISARLQLFSRPDVPQLDYTVCPDCEGMLKSSLHPAA